jgi:signal transduction histidine kinase
MSEEVKSKVFDPFFTTKSVGEGTGLGLSITYTIVEKHKGRMEVISKEGEGTTITLYIPHSLLKTDKKEKD